MYNTEVSINGLKKANDADTASITVHNKEENTYSQLHVGYMTGTGENYRRVDEAQITVWIETNEKAKALTWIGEFDHLKKLLFTKVGGTYYPNSIRGTYDEMFTLQVVTKDYVFYGNEEESDENANTIMYRRSDMELLSNNYFAFSGLYEVAEANQEIAWASEAFTFWQREQFGHRGVDNSQYNSIQTNQTGGNIYNDVITLKDGKLLVMSDELICLYASEEDYENGNALQSIQR